MESTDHRNTWVSIKECLKEFCYVHDLSLDWLIKSWSLEDEDKEIAEAFYRKIRKERARLAQRLNEICQK